MAKIPILTPRQSRRRDPFNYFKLQPFEGLDVEGSATQINDHESPDMLNMYSDERGSLNKRMGFHKTYATTLGPGGILGMFIYEKSDGTVYPLMAWGSDLYVQQGSAQPTSIFHGLAGTDVTFFKMNNLCYILDATNFLVYDGVTCHQITPYIPMLVISSPPAGGGTSNEDFNLIGAGFKTSFSGDGAASVYHLPLNGLDATTVTATVNGINKVEGTDFTVDRTGGLITFVSGQIPSSGTNNVIITAYKTISGKKDQIYKCTFGTRFGGANDTRVFLSGNPNQANFMWASGLTDPTYWPENSFYSYSSDIKALSKQYDSLIVLMKSGVNHVTYTIDSNTGKASFPSKPLTAERGCRAGGSAQIIENNPIFLADGGIFMVVGTNVNDQRDLVHVSLQIDHKLELETALENAQSVVFGKQYWLAVNGNVYVLDTAQKTATSPYGKWCIFNNINASHFTIYNDTLYFGSLTEGMLYQFYTDKDSNNSYNDDGQPINAYWKSKPLSFGMEEMNKMVDRVFIGLKPSGATSIAISYETNARKVDLSDTPQPKFNLFTFTNMDFNNFTFQFSPFPKEFVVRIKERHATHFQITLTNNKLNESLAILSLTIKYMYQNYLSR
jgi:hypothetical protein